jgi:hypothetical protein
VFFITLYINIEANLIFFYKIHRKMLKKLEFFLKIPLCGINFDKKPIQEYQVDNSHLKNSLKRKN